MRQSTVLKKAKVLSSDKQNSEIQSKETAALGNQDFLKVLEASKGLKHDTGINKELPEQMRAKMEAHFGFDLSRVNFKESPEVTQIGAKAYTRGNVIKFAPGQFNPDTMPGRQIIGHELAHVVQQAGGGVKANIGESPVNFDEGSESMADQEGAKAAAMTENNACAPSGINLAPLSVQDAGSAPIQCLTDEETRKALAQAAQVQEAAPAPQASQVQEAAPALKAAQAQEAAPAPQASQVQEAAPALQAAQAQEAAPAPQAAQAQEAAPAPQAAQAQEAAPASAQAQQVPKKGWWGNLWDGITSLPGQAWRSIKKQYYDIKKNPRAYVIDGIKGIAKGVGTFASKAASPFISFFTGGLDMARGAYNATRAQSGLGKLDKVEKGDVKNLTPEEAARQKVDVNAAKVGLFSKRRKGIGKILGGALGVAGGALALAGLASNPLGWGLLAGAGAVALGSWAYNKFKRHKREKAMVEDKENLKQAGYTIPDSQGLKERFGWFKRLRNTESELKAEVLEEQIAKRHNLEKFSGNKIVDKLYKDRGLT